MGIHRYSIIIMWHSTVGIHRYTIIIIIGIQPSHGYLGYLTKKRYDGHGLIVHLRHCGEILGGPSMWKVANQHQNRRDGGIPWLLGVAGLKMFHFPFLLWYQWYQWYRTSQSLGHLTSTCWLKLGDLFMNRSRFKTMLVDDYRGLQLYILVIPPKRSTSKCHCLICCCDFTFLSFGASTIESNLDNLGTITQAMNWESLSNQELTKMVWRVALVWPSDLSCTWQATYLNSLAGHYLVMPSSIIIPCQPNNELSVVGHLDGMETLWESLDEDLFGQQCIATPKDRIW